MKAITDISFNEISKKGFVFNLLLQLFLILVFIIIIYFISGDNYLLFHSIAEIFSIIISFGIFLFVWSSRFNIDNNYFMIIGISFLFIGTLDTLHTFAYQGINIIPGNTANLPTQLWISARYMQSISFLIAPFFISKKIRNKTIVIVYTIITILLLLTIFYWKSFPDCFIEGKGLNDFKKISEYIISLLLLGSIFLLIKKKNDFDKYIFYLVIASIAVGIISEITFTLYSTPMAFFNFLGHILKIISSFFIYKAIIVIGIQNPFNLLFRKIKQREEALQLTRFSIDNSDDFIIWFDKNCLITDINQSALETLGFTKVELINNSIKTIIPDFYLNDLQDKDNKLIKKKNSFFEHYIIKKNGEKIPAEVEYKLLTFGEKIYYYAFARDITERKKAHEKLLESEKRFHQMADYAPVMIWMCDTNKYCNYCNNRWLEFTGRTIEQEIGIKWTESIHPDDIEKCQKEFDLAFENKREYKMEYRLKRFDGNYRWVLDSGVPRLTKQDTFLGYIGSCLDITEMKEYHEQIETSLKEKTVLLKEVHHRVKNNLQVISSLLRLQSSFIKDEDSLEIFMDSQNRVKAMAYIHEILYKSTNLNHVNFSEYIHYLTNNLFSSYRLNLNKIELIQDIQEIEIDVDMAVNIGLIINELVSNSLKYAFPIGFNRENEKNILSIILKCESTGRFNLIVKDNGVGFPKDLDFKNTDSLGMELVNSLTEQYNGNINLNRINGTEFNIHFDQSETYVKG